MFFFSFFILNKRILENKNNELLSLKQQQIEKYNLLLVLQGELNAINEEQKYHEKVRGKYLEAAKNKAKEEMDFEKLQQISKHQQQQIMKITKDIQTLRLKIKPQDQFLLNHEHSQDRTSPQILSFPGFILDAREDSPRAQNTNSPFSSSSSSTSKTSAASAESAESKGSNAL